MSDTYLMRQEIPNEIAEDPCIFDQILENVLDEMYHASENIEGGIRLQGPPRLRIYPFSQSSMMYRLEFPAIEGERAVSTDDMISISRHDAQIIFDLACNMDSACSGYMETEDVRAMRRLASALGVDPATCTGREFVTQFPHKFTPVTHAQMLDARRWRVLIDAPVGMGEARDVIRYRSETDDEVMDRTGHIPPTCGAGTHGRMCAKDANDPIHEVEEAV